MKLLLYCTKQPLFLVRNESDNYYYTMNKGTLNDYKNVETYNGKIVAECDFEVEKIEPTSRWNGWFGLIEYKTSTLSSDVLEKKSCVGKRELDHYLNRDYGYAIHIKNLNIFDKPRGLQYYTAKSKEGCEYLVDKAPQNMMYCYGKNTGEKYILISIRPEWLVKILNGEKTIEIRKKVLKEMIK